MDLRPRGKKDDQNVVDSQDNDNATASKISISPHNSDDSSRLLLSAASCEPADMLATLLREIQDGNRGLSLKIDKKSAELHSSIDDLKSSMNDLLLRTTEAELRISTVEDTIARHDQVLTQLQKDNAYLKNKVDQMENQSRRSNIRVVGLKEDSEGRDPVRFFTQWIPEVLGIINFTKPLEIERAHRTSAPKPRPDEPPRAVLIRFLRFQDREKILQLARAKGDIAIDGKRVSLFPDMSADLARRRKQFRPAAKALKEKNITGYLIHPARMKVQYKGQSHLFNTPLVLSMPIPTKVNGVYKWRLNSTLLKQPEFCAFIKEQINIFTLTNKPSAPDSFILWDTLKAYLRGQIISYTKGLKKKHGAELSALESEISELEKTYQRGPTKDLYRLLVNKTLKYNILNTYQAERAITKSKQRYYELGEKAHKVLAWQLKAEESKRTINAIETLTKEISFDPTEINNTFKKYYEDLYTSQSSDDLSEIDSFLSSLNLPCLSGEDSERLSEHFSVPELLEAIKSLPSNKSPGEDGFPPEFYKEFRELLVPYLMEVLKKAREDNCFPESFSQAVITVIHKKGKNPLKCASYRPISLLNTDCKLVTKMLSKRLESCLPLLVNPDQTGFIINRLSSNNLRRFFDIIHLANKNKIPSVAVSLNAEKAFDRVEWPYLFPVLEKLF